MINKVLIALDYNPSAQKVAEEGARLATAMQARIALLHVVADATYYSSVQYSPIMGLESFGASGLLSQETSDEIKKAAEGFLDTTRQYIGVPGADIVVEEGDFADSILEVAQRTGAGVIVMGTHSRRGLDKILMGSVAEKVLRHTTVPTYIIPTRETKGQGAQ
jgi:nucleotide-binding universal stress UspA family protein